jgi:hypothetical protein
MEFCCITPLLQHSSTPSLETHYIVDGGKVIHNLLGDNFWL